MHVMIVGNSGTGKTNLAKSFALTTPATIIVFDPVESSGWPPSAIKYADGEQFLEDCPRFRNAYVYIDESAVLWDFDESRANELVYRGRHRGLLITMMAQRTRMIRPNARNQCNRVYAFRQQLDDAKTLAAEYHPDFLKCVGMPDGQCVAASGLEVQQLRLDYTSYPPSIVTLGTVETPEAPVEDEPEVVDSDPEI